MIPRHCCQLRSVLALAVLGEVIGVLDTMHAAILDVALALVLAVELPAAPVMVEVNIETLAEALVEFFPGVLVGRQIASPLQMRL